MGATLPGGYVDFSRFAALRAHAHADQGAALAEIGDEFEALFIDLMLKSAREAEMDGGLFESNELSTYREMFDQQIAITMARNHDLGIAEIMKRQLRDFVTPAANDDPAGKLLFEGRPAQQHDGTVDKSAFVSALLPYAVQAAQQLGVSRRALIAQAALETGWGQHVIRYPDGRSSYNLFGIKAGPQWSGDVVSVPTTEYIDGRAVTVDATFRAYESAADAFQDYVEFMQGNPRYAAVMASGSNAAAFAEQLARAGYATDPRYAEKIVAILDTGELD